MKACGVGVKGFGDLGMECVALRFASVGMKLYNSQRRI